MTRLRPGLTRLSTVQEQLSTGKRLNRPSDSPTDTSSAMRLRSSLKAAEQYARNAEDGIGRLGLVDSTLTGVYDGGQSGALARHPGCERHEPEATSREALATEVDQIRADLLGDANTTYLSRPVFGGVTAGSQAYDVSRRLRGCRGRDHAPRGGRCQGACGR